MSNTLVAEPTSIATYMENAYLDYSMYVVLDRALPHLGDGLKPVQRRIIYAMNGLGLSHQSKHKKSARTVGDVLGKYHPHGDSACYEAMVMMAQPFSYRNPVVDGQGNWGSPDDPKSFAAMRYTEARLTPYAQVLLKELSKDTVDYQPNFDGSLAEPVLLPAQVPNILLNGASGIAVGMATDIPPHNLGEVIKATQHVIEHPDASVEDVMHFIPGPDLPTGGTLITAPADLAKSYETGRGTYRVRAKYHIEDKRNLVITELPYQVSGSKLLEQIGALIDAKKLPMIEDLQDESDKHNPIRFVITLKRSAAASAEAVMGHLYVNTDLEKSYKINLNMVALNGAPRVMALNEVLGEWVQFRRQTTTRRLTARVNKIDARLHVLEGLLIAHLNIDEVIRIIRENEDAQSALMKVFSLTEIQAQAILNIKLGQLAKLEEIELQREQSELQKERAELQATLDDPAKLNTLLSEELEEAAKAHANERRTQISHDAPEAKALDATQTLAANPVTVVVSDKGWVRAAKGHQVDDAALSYKTGDGPNLSAPAKANQPVFLMSDQGRVWSLAPHLLPSARGYGEQLMQHNIEPPANTKWKGIFSPHQGDYYVVASSLGYGFVAKTAELATNQKKGKAFLNVAEGVALKPSPVDQEGYVAVLTDGGRLLVFLARELPELAKGKGNKLAKLKVGERVVGVAGLSASDHLIIHTKKDSPKYGPQKWSAFVKERAKTPESLPSYIKGLLGLSVEKR